MQKLVFGMEPTSDYHKPLGEYLISHGHLVVLVGGSAVKKNRELLDGRWDRNDTKDAANVADLITQGKCLFYEFASQDLRELRSLLSLERRLKKSKQAYKIRIRNHLIAQHFPEMDAYFNYREGPALVKWCLDPHEVGNLPFEAFVIRVSSRYVGQEQRKRLMEIHQKAAASIGCAAHPSVAYEAHTLLEGLAADPDHAPGDGRTRSKSSVSGSPNTPFFCPSPGSVPMSRQRCSRPWAIPTGLTTNVRCSSWQDWISVPIRAGSGMQQRPSSPSEARRISAMVSTRRRSSPAAKNRHFMAYFTRKLTGREREKGITTKMRIKLAAKMLVIAWTLMKKREMFDPGCIEE